MSSRRWTISHSSIGEQQVCGFRGGGRALDHARRHLLDRNERWIQICDASQQKTLKDILQQSAQGSVLEQAAALYEELVQTHSQQRLLLAATGLHRMRAGSSQPRLFAVPAAGFFVAFGQAEAPELSDLRTALRPQPRVRRGPVQQRHYLDAARQRFQDQLAASFALSRSRSVLGRRRN